MSVMTNVSLFTPRYVPFPTNFCTCEICYRKQSNWKKVIQYSFVFWFVLSFLKRSEIFI